MLLFKIKKRIFYFSEQVPQPDDLAVMERFPVTLISNLLKIIPFWQISQTDSFYDSIDFVYIFVGTSDLYQNQVPGNLKIVLKDNEYSAIGVCDGR